MHLFNKFKEIKWNKFRITGLLFVLMIIAIGMYEYFDDDDDDETEHSREKLDDEIVKLINLKQKKLSKKMVNAAQQGMVRGAITGSIYGGLPGAVANSVLFAIANPVIVYIQQP